MSKKSKKQKPVPPTIKEYALSCFRGRSEDISKCGSFGTVAPCQYRHKQFHAIGRYDYRLSVVLKPEYQFPVSS